MQYFIENNAAITACTEDEILSSLMSIINTPEMLVEYAENACIAGKTNHDKEKNQGVFDAVIASVMK